MTSFGSDGAGRGAMSRSSRALRIGLRAKIMLISAAVTLFAIAGTVATSDYIFHREYQSVLQSRSVAVGKGLKFQLERLLFLGIDLRDLVGFEDQCREATETNPGVDIAMVASRDGTILFHSDKKATGRRLTDPSLLRVLAAGGETAGRHAISGTPYHTAIVPVMEPGGGQVAMIVTAFSAAVAEAGSRQLQMLSVGVGLLFLVTGLGVLLAALSVVVTRPLDRLIGAVGRIQESRQSVPRVDIHSSDEVGRLAAAFNEMANRLEAVIDRERRAAAAEAAAAEQAKRSAELEKAVAEANQARAEIEANLRAMSDGFYVLDKDWRFTYMNPQAENFLRRRRQDLIGQVVWDAFPEAVQTEVFAKYHQARARNEADSFEIFYPPLEKWFEVRIFPHGDALAVYFHDITEKREAEHRLRQAQKMEAVGQLTGGIAHDFNNLLTVVIGNAGLIADKPDTRAEIKKYAAAVVAAGRRGAELTQRLLAFGRRQTLAPRKIDCNRLIESMRDLLARTLGEDIEMKIPLAGDLWEAFADAAQLESAILNLALNARDAMPNGGALSIATANVSLTEESRVATAEVEPGDYVTISVTDDGEGMPPTVVERAFEPFFTTKDVGKGSGLGLSMVYGFAKQSNGHVTIYSEPGFGTTVRIYLPAIPGRAEKDEASGDVAIAEFPGAGENVLLVEDDDSVRTYAVACLQELGYRVVAAANGREALRRVEEGIPVDVLVTDIVMPGGMNGRQVVEAVRGRRPGVKVLFISGYAEDVLADRNALAEQFRLLNKPFAKPELARALREVMGKG